MNDMFAKPLGHVKTCCNIGEWTWDKHEKHEKTWETWEIPKHEKTWENIKQHEKTWDTIYNLKQYVNPNMRHSHVSHVFSCFLMFGNFSCFIMISNVLMAWSPPHTLYIPCAMRHDTYLTPQSCWSVPQVALPSPPLLTQWHPSESLWLCHRASQRAVGRHQQRLPKSRWSLRSLVCTI